MCFFGFMRAGELVVPSDSGFDPSCHLAAGDVLVDSRTSPSYLVVNVKTSKTDPSGKAYESTWAEHIASFAQ